jgi:diguanylate cyclase (GGDEF)-like protein
MGKWTSQCNIIDHWATVHCDSIKNGQEIMERNLKVRQLKDANAALQLKIKMLEAVVENFPGGLLLFDDDVRLVFCNENQKRLLEYPAELFFNGPPSIEKIFWHNAHRGEYGEGKPAQQVAHRLSLVQKRVAHVFERTRPNGTVLRISGVPLEGGGFMTTYMDVTKEHESKSALAYLALHDTVTGLANRAAFMFELAKRIEELQDKQSGAVFFVDLNKFKRVNDTLGHAAGDELLRLVGNRLRRSIRECDFLARLGGDEFAIIQSEVSRVRDVEALALRIQEIVCNKFEIQGTVVQIGASIGVSLFPEHGTDENELLALADSYMYKSKSEKSSFSVGPIARKSTSSPARKRRRKDSKGLESEIRSYAGRQTRNDILGTSAK